jgi:hypothetical protein
MRATALLAKRAAAGIQLNLGIGRQGQTSATVRPQREIADLSQR